MNTAWQLPSPALLEETTRLTAAFESVYRGIYAEVFADQPLVNHNLPIATRAARELGDWRLFLLLTPWMLVRILVPARAPLAELPAGWHAEERRTAEPVVLGPLVDITITHTPQRAHLNFHPQLGHDLLQPLVLAMEQFATADEVFIAWNEVIRTRDENMKKMERECPMQQEVSRREFFRGLWHRQGS